MTQQYASPVAQERMERGDCPECGEPPATHTSDVRFWIPRGCDLTAAGVRDRIENRRPTGL